MITSSNSIAQSESSELASSVDQILRDSNGLIERIRSNSALPTLAKASITTIAIGAAAFGASLGAYRGGYQILFAAIKFPLVMLLTTAIVAPTLTAINAAFHRESALQKDLALVLSSLARTCLVLAALAPVVLLAITRGAEYHSVILLTVACCSVSGALGIALFLRGLGADSRPGKFAVGLTLLFVFSLVGSQMSWTLRPFLVRPKTPSAPFIRQLEGNFLDSFATSLNSARGIYSEKDTNSDIQSEHEQ